MGIMSAAPDWCSGRLHTVMGKPEGSSATTWYGATPKLKKSVGTVWSQVKTRAPPSSVMETSVPVAAAEYSGGTARRSVPTTGSEAFTLRGKYPACVRYVMGSANSQAATMLPLQSIEPVAAMRKVQDSPLASR